jgi:hypothetical protein
MAKIMRTKLTNVATASAVILSRADGEGPHSRTKNQLDRFRADGARPVEHVGDSLSNCKAAGGPSACFASLGMTRLYIYRSQ